MPFLKNPNDFAGSKNMNPAPKKEASRGEFEKAFKKSTDTTRSLGSHIMDFKEKRYWSKKILPPSVGSDVTPEEIDKQIKINQQFLNRAKRIGGGGREQYSRYQDNVDFLKKAKEKLFGKN